MITPRKIDPRGYFANAKVIQTPNATIVVYCDKCGDVVRIVFGQECCKCTQ